jgi:hypothetical protein
MLVMTIGIELRIFLFTNFVGLRVDQSPEKGSKAISANAVRVYQLHDISDNG